MSIASADPNEPITHEQWAALRAAWPNTERLRDTWPVHTDVLVDRLGRRDRTLIEHLDRIATDIGRLKRLTPKDTSAWWAIDRISSSLEGVDCILQPSAAELYRLYFAICGDRQVSVEEALRDTDKRARRLRVLLGDTERDEISDRLARAQQQGRQGAGRAAA